MINATETVLSNMDNATENAFLSATSKFNWIEYTTFGSLLGLSALVGIYYGCIKGNQNTVNEYMLGGKHMNVFPIAMSLIASHISGITLLGIPSEIYEFGAQYLVTICSSVLIVLITNTFYLPVFFELQLTSLYEYLELRFSKPVRLLGSFIFSVSLILYVPIVIYIPALAFNQVTGISVHSITPIICFLCIFYTTIGGLKAVVWTDAIQSLFTLGSVIIVIILGVRNVGGIQEIYERNEKGGRIDFFNFDLSPYSRVTFLNTIFGMTLMWASCLTIHPGSTQRFVALPTMKAAKRSVVWFGVGVVLIVLLSGFVGMIMYAKYWNCDPMVSQNITSSGKILPYYVQEVAASFPGLTGLFISGLISAALSTMSAGLNTLAGIFYEDFIVLFLPHKVSDATASFIMKITVVFFGCVCVSLVYVIELLGATIVQLSMCLSSAPNGALCAVFVLGIFFPWSNKTGAAVGMITSLIITTWIVTGTQLALKNKELVYEGKPSDTSGCLMNITQSSSQNFTGYEEISPGVFASPDLFFLYKFSFMNYTPIGCLIGVVVGLVVSFCTGCSDLNEMNPSVITPMMRRFLPKSNNENNKYASVAQELKLTFVETK
ncbi:sodium-coupled monocarboxylate transporter 2-like [Planococcus citri]|uniref:sodium-coupled monocarboxylate transporter 2-like n=1 Tax=Planococcus citri TaxID=170843 RepID=UPI0031F9A994